MHKRLELDKSESMEIDEVCKRVELDKLSLV